MAENSLIIIGGSAGSLDVLLKVLPLVPKELTTPIVIVVHRGHSEQSILAGLLSSRTEKPIKEIEDKEKIEDGWMYLAPGDYHLLFERDGVLALDASEKVNFSRPSIDVAFESAAEIFHNRVIAILLSGANSDGTEGLKAVKKAGGKVIIQHPGTAKVPYMVKHASSRLKADLLLTPEEMIEFFRTLQ